MITKITTNWFIDADSEQGYETYEVGKNNVTGIKEHQCGVEGDRWYYLVSFEGGSSIKLFNPDSAFDDGVTDEPKF